MRTLKNLSYRIKRFFHGEESWIVERVEHAEVQELQKKARDLDYFKFIKDDYERFPERVTFRNPLGELHTNLTPITLERIKNLGKKPDYNIRVYKSYKPGDKFP